VESSEVGDLFPFERKQLASPAETMIPAGRVMPR
jgi:hypothetical protein